MFDGVTIPSGGSYPIPEDTTTIDLCSNLPAFEPLGAADASVSGCTITYTVTWQPADGQNMTTDPPPSTAILRADLPYAAGFFGWIDNRAGGTVYASVSLSINGVQYTQNVSHYDGATGQDNGVNWGTSGSPHECVIETVPPDTGSFTYTVTVSEGTHIDFDGSGYGSQTHVYSEAIVTPSVSVTPVVVNLSGTTPYAADNSHNILVGQQCVASLSAGTYALSGCEWSPSGSVVAGYDVAPDDSYGREIELTQTDLTQPTASWYYHHGNPFNGEPDDPDAEPPESATIAVSAVAYDGDAQLGAVTASTKVNVWVPFTDCYPVPSAAYKWWESAPPVEPWPELSAGMNGDPYYLSGILWYGSVIPQDMFLLSSDVGFWCFAQTIVPNREMEIGQEVHNCVLNGVYGLDTVYPYPGTGWQDNGCLYYSGDSPGTPLDPVWTAFNVDNESFNTCLMYMPGACNGHGRQYAPLHMIAWSWSAAASRTLPWPWLDEGEGPVQEGTVSYTFDNYFFAYPEWERKITADDLTWQ